MEGYRGANLGSTRVQDAKPTETRLPGGVDSYRESETMIRSLLHGRKDMVS